MRARMRRFFRPILRRPLPVFLTPTVLSLWVNRTCTLAAVYNNPPGSSAKRTIPARWRTRAWSQWGIGIPNAEAKVTRALAIRWVNPHTQTHYC